jgi:hypothetical protein
MAAQIEATTGRKPGKKEKRDLKEDAVAALLPHAAPDQELRGQIAHFGGAVTEGNYTVGGSFAMIPRPDELDALLLLWLVTTLTFALIHLAPGDPATLLIAPTASAEDAARLRSQLGLDAPLPVQYARWVGGVLQGDLGESLTRAQPVTRVIVEALPVSLFLGGLSMLVSFVLGTLVGAVQALRLSRRADTITTVVTTVLYAAPSFWLALKNRSAKKSAIISGIIPKPAPAS